MPEHDVEAEPLGCRTAKLFHVGKSRAAVFIRLARAEQVHITNIHARESFRQNSYVSKAAKAVIAGFGIDGYALAITGLAGMLGARQKG